MRVIALDPGEMTGYAYGDIFDDKLIIRHHGYATWKETGIMLYAQQLGGNPFSVIVYESWRLRLRDELYGSDMQPSQCIGQIKAAAHWPPTKAILVVNEPSTKPVADKYMERFGIALPKSDVEHNRDAIRHLVHYAVSKKKVKEIVYG